MFVAWTAVASLSLHHYSTSKVASQLYTKKEKTTRK